MGRSRFLLEVHETHCAEKLYEAECSLAETLVEPYILLHFEWNTPQLAAAQNVIREFRLEPSAIPHSLLWRERSERWDARG